MKTLWKRFVCWFWADHRTEAIGKLNNGNTLYQCTKCGKQVDFYVDENGNV